MSRDNRTYSDDHTSANGRYGWSDMYSSCSGSGKRLKATLRACSRLTDEHYARFRTAMSDRFWFVPTASIGGSTKDLPNTKFIYLSPFLEAADDTLLDYITMHEIAHVVLNHRTNLTFPDDRELDARQESEADEWVASYDIPIQRDEFNAFLQSVKMRLGISDT